MAAEISASTAGPARPRHWSDWTGSLVFLALAVTLLWSAPALGLLALPTLLHELLVSVSFLIRGSLRRSLAGVGPRAVAYGGTFLMPLFLQLAARWKPDWIAASTTAPMRAAGIILWLLGVLLALWTVVYLRHAFSIVPQARTLVVSGPYRLARHPMYASYMVVYAGICLLHPQLPLLAAVAAWLALTWLRTRYEEQVLAAEFPEYSLYRKQVGRFLPRLGAQPSAIPVQPTL